jgi:transcriptional regulator with XRE-family HTH domain
MSKNTRLKRSREYKNLSQDELAKLIGSTRGYIAQIEKDKTFSYKKTVKLAQALGLNPDWLETGEGAQWVTEGNGLLMQTSHHGSYHEWVTQYGAIVYKMQVDTDEGVIHCVSSDPEKMPNFDIPMDDAFRVFSAIKGIENK